MGGIDGYAGVPTALHGIEIDYSLWITGGLTFI
jgi:hypothetical protein